ncbi:MAG: DUF1259 domain-containing protein [Gemmatimonadaceae bacterium]|nr:DUF1259 domain-containing protein [Gemmatimonadaceae bacterium]
MRSSSQTLGRQHVSFALTLVILFSAEPAKGQGAPARPTTNPDWSTVEQTLGRKGAPQPGGVIKFGFPRGDLHVVIAGVSVKAALALGSWVAFAGEEGNESMVMGDLVLTQDEVGPVMRKLEDGGVDVTALHNHLEMESPRVMYMHIGAHGDPNKIASVIRDALALTNTPMGAQGPSSDAAKLDLDSTSIAKTLGVSGKVNGGVYQVSVPRLDHITERGMEVPASMGVATAINFQPTGGGKAAVTGDFVMTAEEVNPVIRALTSHGVHVTAIHSHMLDETPRLFFMHFWANDNALSLAAGLRAALDRMNVGTLVPR